MLIGLRIGRGRVFEVSGYTALSILICKAKHVFIEFFDLHNLNVVFITINSFI